MPRITLQSVGGTYTSREVELTVEEVRDINACLRFVADAWARYALDPKHAGEPARAALGEADKLRDIGARIARIP
jgi:hypothetical protein